MEHTLNTYLLFYLKDGASNTEVVNEDSLKINVFITFDFYNKNPNHEWKKRVKLEVNWFGCITLSKEQRISDFLVVIPHKATRNYRRPNERRRRSRRSVC